MKKFLSFVGASDRCTSFGAVSGFLFVFLLLCASCQKRVIVEDISGLRLTRVNTSKDKSKHLILDLRDEEEYKAGHVNYAINIPLHDMKGRVKELLDLKNMPIYMYSRTQDESFEAAQILVEHGFSSIFNAEGTEEYHYEKVHFPTIRVQKVRGSKNSKEFFLIDYRTSSSYNVEHFKEAVNVPIGEIPNKLHLLPKDKNRPIVIYCNTGVASAWAAKELLDLGYTNVSAVLEGAIEDAFVREMEKENVKED